MVKLVVFSDLWTWTNFRSDMLLTSGMRILFGHAPELLMDRVYVCSETTHDSTHLFDAVDVPSWCHTFGRASLLIEPHIIQQRLGSGRDQPQQW
jgi:hypothetical protein